MRLTRIELENFRGFGQAQFDLTERDGQRPHMVAILVGTSGTGKSALLQALCGFFGGLANRLVALGDWRVDAPNDTDLYLASPLNNDDIRQGAEYCRLRVLWNDDVPLLPSPAPPSLECEAYLVTIDKPREALTRVHSIRRQNHLFAANDVAYASPTPEHIISWRACARLDQGATGLIVAFDDLRLLPRLRVPGPNRDAVFRHRCRAALAPSDQALTAGPNQPSLLRFQPLKQWLVNLDYARLKGKERNQSVLVWEQVVSALNRLLAPCEFLGVDENNDLLFRTPTGTVRLESLSSGFRSLFVVAIDLLLRLSLANNHGEDLLTRQAVCMIDEIDAHLDPGLQERVIGDLRAIFPGVQFIVTTHSDLVVGSVSRDQIFILGEE